MKTLKSIGSEHSLKGDGITDGIDAHTKHSDVSSAPPKGLRPPVRSHSEELMDAYSLALRKSAAQQKHLDAMRKSAMNESEEATSRYQSSVPTPSYRTRRISSGSFFPVEDNDVITQKQSSVPAPADNLRRRRLNSDELLEMYDQAKAANDKELDHLGSEAAMMSARYKSDPHMKKVPSSGDIFLPSGQASEGLNAELLEQHDAQEITREGSGKTFGAKPERSDSTLEKLYESSMARNRDILGNVAKKQLCRRRKSAGLPGTPALASLELARSDSKRRIAAECQGEADLAARGTSILRASVNGIRSNKEEIEELANRVEASKSHRRDLSTRGIKLLQKIAN